jgi:uncharacterized membrane protein
MLDRNVLLLQIPAIVGAGLIAGTFFCFSSFVMPALSKLEQTQGIAAMQKINVTVVNPLFMSVLFGTAILYLIQAYMAMRTGANTASLSWLLATVLYVVGTIGITLFRNVPLNEQLAAISNVDYGSSQFWSHYVQDWTIWNSFRALAATATCAISIHAISVAH